MVEHLNRDLGFISRTTKIKTPNQLFPLMINARQDQSKDAAEFKTLNQFISKQKFLKIQKSHTSFTAAIGNLLEWG